MDVAVKKTYPQNWKAYNAAQTNEKHLFLKLLFNLCKDIDEPRSKRNGRPRLLLSDALFSACYKVYSGVSGRRFMSDLRDAQAKGYITKTPHFNSISNYLDDPDLTPELRILINKTSLPLKDVEFDFAVDSSGFMNSRVDTWFDHRYGVKRKKHGWVKVHLMCGVRTNIVTAVEIMDKYAADNKFFPHLVDTTAATFEIHDVLADKAYGSRRNYNAVIRHGGTPFIAFKEGHTGRVGGAWEKMFHYFQYRREDFLRHYHKRSNVESTFSMIKAKFREHVRSRTDTAMKNEVFLKIISHNICCLISAMFELGIDPFNEIESQNGQTNN